MSKNYDLHLSAYSISPETIVAVESLGFLRDKFANNRYCDTTAYHATYRGDSRLPNNKLWRDLEVALTQDSSFAGGLEEEEYTQEEVVHFAVDNVSEYNLVFVERLPFHRPIANEYKVCDIHLNVALAESSAAIAFISSIECASFDEPDTDGAHRIFSATCDSLDSGRKLFRLLCGILEIVPGLKAKMKFERTTRSIRIPLDAPALPLLSAGDLEHWLLRHAGLTKEQTGTLL